MMPFFLNKRRDRGTNVPYSWYWKGKSLRTGDALGERIQSIQVPQRSLIGDAYFNASPVLVDPASMHSQIGDYSRCPLNSNSHRGFDEIRHKECSHNCCHNCCHYGRSPTARRTNDFCCFSDSDCNIPSPRSPDFRPQPISEPSMLCRPTGHYYASSLDPCGYDHTLVDQNSNPCPLFPVSGVPCSCSQHMGDQSEIHLGGYQCSHNSPHFQENEAGMRTNSPAAGPYPDAYMGRRQPNASCSEKPCFCKRMTGKDTSKYMPSGDDTSTDVENRSYYRRRPRARHYKYQTHRS